MTALTTRNAQGRAVTTTEHATRDAQAAAMYARGMTFKEIGATFGVTKQAAHQMRARALAAAGKQDREEALAIELAKLDAMEQAAWVVLARNHIVVSNGRVMVDPRSDEADLVLLEDDGPVLQAVSTLLKVAERRAKMIGLDAPARVEVSDKLTTEIERLAADLGVSV